jgi:hypothetical protein
VKGEKGINFGFRIADCELTIIDYKLQITDYRLFRNRHFFPWLKLLPVPQAGRQAGAIRNILSFPLFKLKSFLLYLLWHTG